MRVFWSLWFFMESCLLLSIPHSQKLSQKLAKTTRWRNIDSTHESRPVHQSHLPTIRRFVELGGNDQAKLFLLPEIESSSGALRGFANPVDVFFQTVPSKSSEAKDIENLIPKIIRYKPLFSPDQVKFDAIRAWHNCSWMLDMEDDLIMTACSDPADQIDELNQRSRIYIYKLDDMVGRIDLLKKTEPQPYDILKCYAYATVEGTWYTFALCEIRSTTPTSTVHKLTLLTLNTGFSITNSTTIEEQTVSSGPSLSFPTARLSRLSLPSSPPTQTVSPSSSRPTPLPGPSHPRHDDGPSAAHTPHLLVCLRHTWSTVLLRVDTHYGTARVLTVGRYEHTEEGRDFRQACRLEAAVGCGLAVRAVVACRSAQRALGEESGGENFFFVEQILPAPANSSSQVTLDFSALPKLQLQSLTRDTVLVSRIRVKQLFSEDGTSDQTYTTVTLVTSTAVYVHLVYSPPKHDYSSVLIASWTYALSENSPLAEVLHVYESKDNEVFVLGLTPARRMLRVFIDTDRLYLFAREETEGDILDPVYSLVIDNPVYPNRFVMIWKEKELGLLVTNLTVHEIEIGLQNGTSVASLPPFPVPFRLAAQMTLVDSVTEEAMVLELTVVIFQEVNAFSRFDMRNQFTVFLGQKSYIPILPIYLEANSPTFSVEVVQVEPPDSLIVKAHVKNFIFYSQLSLPRSPKGRVQRFTAIGGIYFRLQTNSSSMVISCLTSPYNDGKAICIKLFEISFDTLSEAILSMRYTNGFIFVGLKFFQGSLRRLQFRIYDLQGGLVAKSILYEYDVSELYIRDDLNGDIVFNLYGAEVGGDSSGTRGKSVYSGIISIGSDRKVNFPDDFTLYRALPMSVSVKQLHWTPSILFNVLTLVLQGTNSVPSVMTILSFGKSSEVTQANSMILYAFDLVPAGAKNTTVRERTESCTIGENPVIFLMTSQQIVTVQRQDEANNGYSKITLPFSEYGMTRIIDYACLREDDFLQVLAEKKDTPTSSPTYYLISYNLNSVALVNSRVHSLIQLPTLPKPPRHLTAASQTLPTSKGLQGTQEQGQEADGVFDVVSIITDAAFDRWLVYSFNTGAPLLEVDVSPARFDGAAEATLRISMTPFGSLPIFKVSRNLRLDIREASNPVQLHPKGSSENPYPIKDQSSDLNPFLELEKPSDWNLDDLLQINGTILDAKLENVQSIAAEITQRVKPTDLSAVHLQTPPKMMSIRSRHGCVLVWNETDLLIYEANRQVFETKIYTGIAYLGFPIEAPLPVITIKSEFSGERSLFYVIYRDPGNQNWVQVSALSNIDIDFIRTSVLHPVIVPDGNSTNPSVVSFYCIMLGYELGSQYIYKSVLHIVGQAEGQKQRLEIQTRLLHGFDDPISAFDIISFSEMAHALIITKRSAQLHILHTDRIMENYQISSFPFEPAKVDATDGLFTCNLQPKTRETGGNFNSQIICLLSTLAVESFQFTVAVKIIPGAPYSTASYTLGNFTGLGNIKGFTPVRGSVAGALTAVQTENKRARQSSTEDFRQTNTKTQTGRATGVLAGEEAVLVLFSGIGDKEMLAFGGDVDSEGKLPAAVVTLGYLQAFEPSQRLLGFSFDIETTNQVGDPPSAELVVLLRFEAFNRVRRFQLGNLTLKVSAPGKLHKKKGTLTISGLQNTVVIGLDQLFKPNYSKILLAWTILVLIAVCLFVAGACLLKHKGDDWFPPQKNQSRPARSFGSEDISLEHDGPS